METKWKKKRRLHAESWRPRDCKWRGWQSNCGWETIFPPYKEIKPTICSPYLGNEESWNTVSCERFNLGIIFSRVKRIILRVFQIFFNHRYTYKNRRIVWHVEIRLYDWKVKFTGSPSRSIFRFFVLRWKLEIIF